MKVLLVDDSGETWKRIGLLVSSVGGVIVGGPQTSYDASAVVTTYQPDVVVLVLPLRGSIGGLEWVRAIKEKHPSLQIIALADYHPLSYRRRYLLAGADFFSNKSDDFKGVSDALRRILQQATAKDEGA